MTNVARALTVALALTGFAASTRVNAASAQTPVIVSKVSAIPPAYCPLKNPQPCNWTLRDAQ